MQGTVEDSSLTFHLDGTTRVPPERQIVDQVKQALRLGRIKRGDRLPPVHYAAGSLSIKPTAIAKAYRQLQGEGLIVSHRAQGTFVDADPTGASGR